MRAPGSNPGQGKLQTIEYALIIFCVEMLISDSATFHALEGIIN